MVLQIPVRGHLQGPAATSGPATTGRGGFRADVQALRALAVSLVVVYHLWPTAVPGGFVGVDVFFVISGFLITSHLLSRPPASGSDLVRFWSRRARRLLPAALLVLLVTLVAGVVLLPSTQWPTVAREVVAATLYVENWQLASTSVDYLAAANAPSAVQHFWSLSVEEQFYLVWPVVLLGLVALARRRGWPLRATVGAGLGALTLASLLLCLRMTTLEPALAYFATPARLWELGAGALLAVGASSGPARTWTLTPRGRRALLLVGALLVVAAASLLGPAQPFPGWRALLPVAGTVLVIAAAAPTEGSRVGRLVASSPVQGLGNISYSVYLWHWPLVVLAPYAVGHPLGHFERVAVLAASLVLGWLSKTFVEDRLRSGSLPPARVLRRAAAAMTVVVALAALLLVQTVVAARSDAQRLSEAVREGGPCFGAAALTPGSDCPPTTVAGLVPSPEQAAADKSEAYDRGCFSSPPFTEVRRCEFGDPAAPVSVALVGNSHAGHWLPALQRVAEQQGWRVTTFLASECSATSAPVQWDSPAKQDGCLRWAERVREATRGQQFDLVVTSERNGRAAVGATYATSRPAWLQGYRDYLREWRRGGTRLLVVADTATPGATMRSVPDCLAEHRDDLAACSGPRSAWVPDDPLVQAAREADDARVTTVDLNDRICGAERCEAAVGGVTVYSDASHLTRTYAGTLAPYLEPSLLAAVRR